MEFKEAQLYEVLHKSDEKNGIHLSNGEQDQWFTVVGPAKEFLPKIVKGDMVECTFKDGKVTFIKASGKAVPVEKKEFVSGQEIQELEHPAFLGMCMNQALTYGIEKSKAGLTQDGFFNLYKSLVKEFYKVNKELKKELGED